jgi:hypothetical protein
MEKLSNDIEALKATIKPLVEQIRRLGAENAELRRRFGRDRTNSHKPPSSDGDAKKSLKPGRPKEKQTNCTPLSSNRCGRPNLCQLAVGPKQDLGTRLNAVSKCTLHHPKWGPHGAAYNELSVSIDEENEVVNPSIRLLATSPVKSVVPRSSHRLSEDTVR